MKTLTPQMNFRQTNFFNPTANPTTFFTIPIKSHLKQPKTNFPSPPFTLNIPKQSKPLLQTSKQFQQFTKTDESSSIISSNGTRVVLFGAVSIGIAMFLMGFDDQKALALGPEGPLMEEFWDNMRRYALYALTVSTGVLYAVFQPIYELLKNPISAILVLIILGGGFYIVSQVVSAMVGVSDFAYQYSY